MIEMKESKVRNGNKSVNSCLFDRDLIERLLSSYIVCVVPHAIIAFCDKTFLSAEVGPKHQGQGSLFRNDVFCDQYMDFIKKK